MKKLMIAAAIVCAAVMSQAATVNWKAGTMYAAVDKNGTPGTVNAEKFGATGHKGTMYLFYFDSLTDYQTAQGLTTSALYEKYILDSKMVSSAVSSKAASTLGTTIKLENQPDGTDVKPITLYGMALFVDKESAANFEGVDAFVKSAFDTGSYADANGTDFNNLGAQQSSWTAYSAVPEPTSGLLLLLGVAGLALRRRRA